MRTLTPAKIDKPDRLPCGCVLGFTMCRQAEQLMQTLSDLELMRRTHKIHEDDIAAVRRELIQHFNV